MKKVYLSPAAHATDNPTKCLDKCGENVHANEYMDIVERRLKELGVSVMRGDKNLTGSAAMTARVKEANKWKADLYYVAHTNAGGGRYAVTYSYNNTASKNMAQKFGAFKKAVQEHNGYKWRAKTNNSLYEINSTAMLCLYDELFFHDNAEDCKWFHDGGMEKCAEETVQGICAVIGVDYKTAAEVKAPTVAVPVAGHPAGEKIVLYNKALYASAATKKVSSYKSGTFYVYDGKPVNGRYRITNAKNRVGKTPAGMNVTGWVVL